MRLGVCLLIGWMLVTLVLPLWALLYKSFQNQDGQFVGVANYIHYFSTPALFDFSGFSRTGVGDPRQVQLAVKFIF